MEIYGYKRNYTYTFVTWLAIIASGFLLRLVFYWKPNWMLYATYCRCPLEEAEKVLLIDKYHQCFVERVLYLQGVPHPATLYDDDDVDELGLQNVCKKSTVDDDDELLWCPDKAGKTKYAHNTRASYGSLGRPTPIGPTVTIKTDDEEEEEQQQVEVRYFENKKIRYVWRNDEENFVKLRGFDKNVSLAKLQSMTGGLSKDEQQRRQRLFGENAVHVEVAPYFRILVEEVLGPFYIFQVFSCTIWFNDDYYYYGSCIIVMSLLSLVSSVIQIRRNQEQLRDTVESVDYVKVCRGPNSDYYEEIDSAELVPGDVVVVPTFNSTLQFDGVLINGNVIVNESMLTGESVPVTKTPLPLPSSSGGGKAAITSSSTSSSGSNSAPRLAKSSLSAGANNHLMFYDEKEHSKHTLFCGTKVLQTRYYGGVHVKALVIRVGFQTAKGELIRSIMFPKPVDFRFNKQIHKFIGVLACVALLGFGYSVLLKTKRGADLKTILISALDLITIVVPPALPAAMTIGIIYAQSRLKSNKIFCISPRSINISGCINCVCFDKTGTLTEDNLSFNEVVPLIEDKCQFGNPFDEEVMQTNSRKIELSHHLLKENGVDYTPLMICLASCHSLTIIDQKIIGDPLDLQMFEATGWVLEEPDVDDETKFDLSAPTVVRPPRRKRRTPPEEDTYAASSDLTSSCPSSDCDEQDEPDLRAGKPKSSSPSSQATLNNVELSKRCQKDVGILRQFPFSSSLQRMSVITRQFNGSQYVVYTKGAPEKIASLCDQTTLPENFNDVLHDYTHRGFRVLALAYRPLKVGLNYTRMQRATRNDIEKDLRFLGLLTLGNLLKPETVPVISTLNRAAIRCVMVTGDNMLTAVSVANECAMISSHDRTILLQVEKSATSKSPRPAALAAAQQPVAVADTTSAAAAAAAETKLKQTQISTTSCEGASADCQPATQATAAAEQQPQKLPNPLILNVENIQLQVRTESEPILSARRAKEPSRPKLTWQFINNSGPTQQKDAETATGAAGGLSAPSNAKQGVRIDVPPADETRIHLALTGETWDVIQKHYPELLNAVCVRGTVFARMSPQQKQQLVEQLQAMQYYVGMCGDGANDSGALRSAHAGISLSDTEASVAAPFTSANANISCVPILISEGRAALVTAFGILKYMALYSLIQFCSVLLLYTFYTNFTDMEFLYEDLFIIATFVAVFGRTEPYPKLHSKAPPSSLLSVTQLSSVGIQLLLVVFFQLLSLVILWQNTWYKPHEPNYDHELDGHDNFAIFAVSAFQCITLAVVFSKGKPYRKSILTNYLLTGALLAIVTATLIILIIPAEWNVPYISLSVTGVTLEFRLLIVLLVFVHFVLAIICERFIVDHLIFKESKKFLEIFGIKTKCSIFETIDSRTRSLDWLKTISKESA